MDTLGMCKSIEKCNSIIFFQQVHAALKLSHSFILPSLCTCLEYSLKRQAPKQYCSAVSLQRYAVCQRILASAWPSFHAGGTIRKTNAAPNSAMVVAVGTITTSNLTLSAIPSAQECVSLRGPISHAHLHRWEVWVLVGPFQEVGSPGAHRTSPH